ncbi:MAG: OmpA family protein [Curvibacter lanceolatus]|uniref:flagellar motor protein MotB n=1 Tax=Curvibacter lanceolatus TaxID=86182 RepID=UPI0023525407|nr:flagellar motor protein MotB [Curvibacter lanceolatus]MBV5293590.1 OmpA family protein [Curvibacter lanceolatus]
MSTGARDKGHDTVVKRVNRKHEEESHGGAWKVAFADFCLALMCLFLVLWVLAARNTERLEESMRTTRGKLFDEGTGRHIKSLTSATGSLIPREPVPSQGDAPPDARRAYTNGESGRPEKLIGQAYPRTRYDSEAELRKLASTLMNLSQDAGLDSNVQTIVMPYGLRVMLHDTEQQGMFERGSAQPTERAKRLLRKMGPVFARMDNQMLVIGHTDSTPFANDDGGMLSNWPLSNERAIAARYQLMAGGMAADSTLQVVGMADRALFDAEHPRADVNRRIELLVLTSEQARAVSVMFGAPGQSQPLAQGASTALPDAKALSALHNSLTPAR